MPSDPYQILQVPRQASPDQIRAAYLRLVLAHHPDLNPGDDLAAERFKQVQRAYEEIVQRFPARERSSFGAALDPPFVRAQFASIYAARSRGMASPAWDARSFSAGALAAVAILVALTGSVLWTERGSRLWEKSVRRIVATVRTSQAETAAPHTVSGAADGTPTPRSTMSSTDAEQASQAVRRSDDDVDAATIAAGATSADEPASTSVSAEQPPSVSANIQPTDPLEEVLPVAVASPPPSAVEPDTAALAPDAFGADPSAQGTVAVRHLPTAPLPPDPSWSASTQAPMPSSTVGVENSGSRTTPAPLAAIDLWTLHKRAAPGTSAAPESVAGESSESAPSLSGRPPSPWSRFSDLGPGRPIPQPLPTMSLSNPAGAATTGVARGGSLLAQPLASPLGSFGKASTGTGAAPLGRLTPDITSPLPNLTRPAGPTSPGVPPATTGGRNVLTTPNASASGSAVGTAGPAWRSTAASGYSVPVGGAGVGGAPQGAVTIQRTPPALPDWSNPPWKTPARPLPGAPSSPEFDR